MYLVRLQDLRVQRLVSRPIVFFGHGVTMIPKTAIVCDACNQQVACTEQDLKDGLTSGYAVMDGDYIVEVVCDKCRERYFGDAPVFNTLEEGLGEHGVPD